MVSVLLIFPLLLLGLAFGSFLNVLIFRLNDEKTPKFWQGRSICPKCKHQLSWKDNVPLLSFLMLSGRCRYCRKKISWQYPIVEILSALGTVSAWFYIDVFSPTLMIGNFSFLVSLVSLLIIVYSLIVIFFSDWIYGLIPDEMVITGLLGALVFNFQFNNSHLGQNLLVGIFSSLGFLLVVVATRFRGMGLGDVKFAFLMGILLGWPNIFVGLWVAFILGGMVALLLLVLHRKKFRDTIALGPYLVIGTLVALVWSRQLLGIIGYYF